MDLKDWVKAARKHAGKTQQQLGDAVGRTKANVGHWENGLHLPSWEMIQAIAASTGYPMPPVSIDHAYPIASDVGEPIALQQFKLLPVVGEVKGGDDGYLDELQYPVGHGEGFIEYPTKDPHAYALRVRGDSMHPRYRAGEFAVIEPSIEAQEGDDVVVICNNGKKMLKQLNWRRDGEVQLLSINNGYGPLTISMHEIESIQLVAGRARRTALTR